MFMENVLINEEKNKIIIEINIKEMIDDNDNVTVRIKYDSELLKEEKFVKKGGKDEKD